LERMGQGKMGTREKRKSRGKGRKGVGEKA
jgi:hypothetical protein